MDNRNSQGMRNSNMTGSSFKIGNKVKSNLIQNQGQAGNLYLYQGGQQQNVSYLLIFNAH